MGFVWRWIGFLGFEVMKVMFLGSKSIVKNFETCSRFGSKLIGDCQDSSGYAPVGSINLPKIHLIF